MKLSVSPGETERNSWYAQSVNGKYFIMNKFLEEIQEQPEALKQTFCYYRSEEGKKSLKTVCALWKSGEYDRIVFTGMGSSYFISQAAATMISSASIPASAINAGELLHFQSPSHAFCETSAFSKAASRQSTAAKSS